MEILRILKAMLFYQEEFKVNFSELKQRKGALGRRLWSNRIFLLSFNHLEPPYKHGHSSKNVRSSLSRFCETLLSSALSRQSFWQSGHKFLGKSSQDVVRSFRIERDSVFFGPRQQPSISVESYQIVFRSMVITYYSQYYKSNSPKRRGGNVQIVFDLSDEVNQEEEKERGRERKRALGEKGAWEVRDSEDESLPIPDGRTNYFQVVR